MRSLSRSIRVKRFWYCRRTSLRKNFDLEYVFEPALGSKLTLSSGSNSGSESLGADSNLGSASIFSSKSIFDSKPTIGSESTVGIESTFGSKPVFGTFGGVTSKKESRMICWAVSKGIATSVIDKNNNQEEKDSEEGERNRR